MKAICWNGAAGKAPRRICVIGPSNLPHHRNGKTPRRALGERFLCEIG
jgi:hypothetical protein